jgi:hypothetical protein
MTMLAFFMRSISSSQSSALFNHGHLSLLIRPTNWNLLSLT